MKINCPHCGKSVVVNDLGRKRLNIPLKNVCDRIYFLQTVVQAAKELKCSKSYVFKVLKANNIKLADVLNGCPIDKEIITTQMEK